MSERAWQAKSVHGTIVDGHVSCDIRITGWTGGDIQSVEHVRERVENALNAVPLPLAPGDSHEDNPQGGWPPDSEKLWGALRDDITTPEDVSALLRLAAEMAPLVGVWDAEERAREWEDVADEISDQ